TGKLAGAIEEYQAAERLDAKEYEIRFALGRALLRANRATQAEAEFREALALRGDAAPARLGLAESLRAQNKLEAAAAEFAAYLHARLGRVCLEKRDFPAAERELRQALQLDRNWTDALRDLVAVYYLGERYQATLQILDELDRRETPGAGSWFIRATCYDKLGRKADSVAAYEQSLGLDQGHSENQGFQARQRIRILARELEHKKR